MSYSSLHACIQDLEKHGRLLRIKEEVDPNLEMAAIHRQVYDAGGPALLFERVKGSPFPAASNLYGTFERTEFIFRDTIAGVKKVLELKADPTNLLRKPGRYVAAPATALSALPMQSRFGAPILYGETTIDQLPQVKSWPMDGGAFITLPQVFTLPPGSKQIMQSNLGMYRIQLSGNDYVPNKEIGLHYQLHRGIGVHHTAYNQTEEPFRASIFVGGPPSHAFAAIMPLPEGLSELTFAGLLGGRRFRYLWKDGYVLSADADFVITGTIRKQGLKSEGPFGDHLGYYSLAHDFPVMDVEKVYYRKDAIWHFTAVGRPPQEDSSFGYLIHQLVEPLTPGEFPGIVEINAVDAAGVHPLLLAIGSERYMPFRERKPEEILTQANHLLGKGQTSLAKFLLIAAAGDAPNLHTHDMPHFFQHVLSRVDWRRDLHFQTNTTIDTLDYSGSGWNAGSKVVIACCGAPIRKLGTELPKDFSLPEGYSDPCFVMPGILAIKGPAFENEIEVQRLALHLDRFEMDSIPLLVLADDSQFVAATLNNFLWVTFTRANPSHDIHGVRGFVEHKHWGCEGSLIIDARIKPHHAPPLVEDEEAAKRAEVILGKYDWSPIAIGG
ncbi:MAG: UbiD family decarboxylase [Saprospirales bacterium]|nr:UbiD family decarboxylase [Saprospirales bacterium]MBK8490465.1 UbiD family decarboxylase [Saprospirales bacterium]